MANKMKNNAKMFDVKSKIKSCCIISVMAGYNILCVPAYSDQEKPVTVRIEGKLKDPKSKDERLKQGAVICLNDDDDNFVQDATENKEDFQEDGPIANEDDLQPIKLVVDPRANTTGQIILEINGGGNIKIWPAADKAGNPLLSPTLVSKTWTIAQFKASAQSTTPTPGTLTTMTLYMEGVKRSNTPRDTSIKLTYKRPTTPATGGISDELKCTVVQTFLDVDNDGALNDDNPGFWPGRNLDRTPSLQIAKNSDKITPQPLKMIVAPFDATMNVAVEAELLDVSKYPGVCMNRGHSKRDDLSFAPVDNKTNATMILSGSKMDIALYCNDFAAKGTFKAKISRAGAALTQCSKQLPVDSDRDLLPDVFEDAYRLVGGIAGGAVMLDKNKSHTTAGLSDAEIDVDGTPVTPGLNTKVSFNPQLGLQGDGFSAFEEYRGFESRATANFDNSKDIDADDQDASRYINFLNPNVKDLFVRAKVFLNPNSFKPAKPQVTPRNLGIGAMTAWEAHGLKVWRLTDNELMFASGIVNYNRITGPPQLAVRIVVGNAKNEAGNAPPGGLRTGDDGIRQSVRTPNDAELISRYQGLKEAIVIRAGANGIIDPPYNRAKDTLDAVTNRITEGGDGRLDTVTSTYTPIGNDRVQGTIHAPTEASLSKETVAGKNPADILRGSIKGDAKNPLDPATVASALPDELVDVVLDYSNVPIVPPVAATDTVKGKVISPGNDGFQTPLIGEGFYRGTIGEGADEVLSAVPHGNDQVFGTIEAGSDFNLQSRPQKDDFVKGFIDGGPTGGKLDPLVNNAHAQIHNSGGLNAADDDKWIEDLNIIHAGNDGVCNTVIQEGADDGDLVQPGNGEPNSTALLPDSNGILKSVKSADDYIAIYPDADNQKGSNQSPNEHEPVEINIENHLGLKVGDDCFQPPNVLYSETDVHFYQRLIETMGHEGSHACHLSHWWQGRGVIKTVTQYEDPLGAGNPPLTIPAPIKMIFPDANGPFLQFEVFVPLMDGFGLALRVVDPDDNTLKMAYRSFYLLNEGATPGTKGNGHSEWTNMTSNCPLPVPQQFDAIDLDQLRLHLRQ